MSVWTFFREFARDPVLLGAVAPSGRALAERMVDAAGIGPGHAVVELGAGTGPMTAALLARHPELGQPGAPFVTLEPNPALAAVLRARFPGVRVEERYAQQLRAILDDMKVAAVDRVVSSLPWAIWPEALQDEVFRAILDVMAPEGRMVTFGYLHALPLPAARRLRRALEARFEGVHTTPAAWANLPPALVYVCDRPRRAA